MPVRAADAGAFAPRAIAETVDDLDGPLPGVAVELHGTHAEGALATATTDDDGHDTFPLVDRSSPVMRLDATLALTTGSLTRIVKRAVRPDVRHRRDAGAGWGDRDHDD